MKAQRNRRLPYYEMGGAGLGAAIGWLLASPADQRLWLGIGGGLGALIGTVWKRWWLEHRHVTQASARIGWGGTVFYLVAIALCLAGLWFPLRTAVHHPEKWLAVVAGVLFFATGAVVMIVLWIGDRSAALVDTSGEARRNWALGLASFVLASTGLLVIALGNATIGILSAAFFGLCGVIALRRARAAKR